SDIDSEVEQQNYSLQNNMEPKNMEELTVFVQNMLQNVQDKFQLMSDQILSRIDEMGTRIDDLEKNLG
uniref:Heat shock factor-binding protein 1 n=1 Tax=Megaselia scalaris TaxID=36166 RepID=T1H799_MEGSC